jgi:Spy/CpxP family protein refolding chaperone
VKRGAAIAWVTVVFLVGLAAGVLGARLLRLDPSGDRDRFGPPPFQSYFTPRDLDLSADQRQRLEEVFKRQRQKFEALHRDLRPRVEALMDETQAELEAILSPEQLERYRARRDRWHRPRDRHGPPHRRFGGEPPPPNDETNAEPPGD